MKLIKGLRNWRFKLRRFSAHKRALPDFVVIGVPKSGTTSMFQYLAGHDQVLPPIQKEIYFFDRYHDKGQSWYQRFFPLRKELQNRHLITGEASPYYFYGEQVPGRIHKINPQIKLILVLRDPVERAWSHFRHNVKHGVEPRSFADAIHAEINGERPQEIRFRYLENGRYADFVDSWNDQFDSSQLLVLESAKFFGETHSSMNRVAEFLNIRPFPTSEFSAANVGSGSSEIPQQESKLLAEHFADSNHRLIQQLGNEFGNWIA